MISTFPLSLYASMIFFMIICFYTILISDLTWREFKAVEQLIDRPGLRLSFLDGVLEIRKMLL